MAARLPTWAESSEEPSSALFPSPSRSRTKKKKLTSRTPSDAELDRRFADMSKEKTTIIKPVVNAPERSPLKTAILQRTTLKKPAKFAPFGGKVRKAVKGAFKSSRRLADKNNIKKIKRRKKTYGRMGRGRFV